MSVSGVNEARSPFVDGASSHLPLKSWAAADPPKCFQNAGAPLK